MKYTKIILLPRIALKNYIGFDVVKLQADGYTAKQIRNQSNELARFSISWGPSRIDKLKKKNKDLLSRLKDIQDPISRRVLKQILKVNVTNAEIASDPFTVKVRKDGYLLIEKDYHRENPLFETLLITEFFPTLSSGIIKALRFKTPVKKFTFVRPIIRGHFTINLLQSLINMIKDAEPINFIHIRGARKNSTKLQ
jgi:hypothetical protein